LKDRLSKFRSAFTKISPTAIAEKDPLRLGIERRLSFASVVRALARLPRASVSVSTPKVIVRASETESAGPSGTQVVLSVAQALDKGQAQTLEVETGDLRVSFGREDFGEKGPVNILHEFQSMQVVLLMAKLSASSSKASWEATLKEVEKAKIGVSQVFVNGNIRYSGDGKEQFMRAYVSPTFLHAEAMSQKAANKDKAVTSQLLDLHKLITTFPASPPLGIVGFTFERLDAEWAPFLGPDLGVDRFDLNLKALREKFAVA